MAFIKDKVVNVQSIRDLEQTEIKGSIPGGTTENQAVTIICDCFFVFMANEFVCVTYENAKQD